MRAVHDLLACEGREYDVAGINGEIMLAVHILMQGSCKTEDVVWFKGRVSCEGSPYSDVENKSVVKAEYVMWQEWWSKFDGSP